jgi:hypothetical protein
MIRKLPAFGMIGFSEADLFVLFVFDVREFYDN